MHDDGFSRYNHPHKYINMYAIHMYAIHTVYILQFEFRNELAHRKFIRRLELWGCIYRAAVNWYRTMLYRMNVGLVSISAVVCVFFPRYISAQYKYICTRNERRCRLNGNRAVMLIRRLGFLLLFLGQLRFARNGHLYRENPFSISMRSLPAPRFRLRCLALKKERRYRYHWKFNTWIWSF